MSCRRFERSLALAIGGDLPARQQRRLDAHVATCASCRALASRLREDRAALAAVVAEAPALAELSALRASVLAQVGRERLARTAAAGGRPAFARLATVGAAAVLLLGVLAVVAVRRPAPPAAPGRPVTARQTVDATPAPAAPLVAAGSLPRPGTIRPVAPAAHPVRRPVRPAVRQAVAPAPPATAEPLVIKLLTDDPDVVIYWLADSQKG